MKLDVLRRFDIPLREVSGICSYRLPDGRTALAAMGDASPTLVWTVASADVEPAWHELDLGPIAGDALPASGTQIEAIASDAAGHLVIVLEEPSRVLVLDPVGRRLLHRIELVVPPDQPIAEAWATEPNSRGEGVVLLADGRLLVVKEKRPAALVEFGPVGAEPLGLGPDRLLGPGASWRPPTSEVAMFEALATWLLDDDLAQRVGDLSDAAVGHDGRLYLLSDQSSRVVRVAALPPPGHDRPTFAADQVFTIRGKPDKAEGLATLPDGHLLVALDTKRPAGNLLLLGPPVAGP